jgi:hypothetical protein
MAQEKGKYNLMDAFNIVQLIIFIQNNLDKVKAIVQVNIKKQESVKEEEIKPESKQTKKEIEKETNEEDELSELTEPIPLRGVVNI